MAERTRTYSWHDPEEVASRYAGMTGIEVLRAWRAGEVPSPPMGETMGISLLEVAEGTATLAAEPQDFHYNPVGVVHGGFALTMLDFATGCAHLTMLPAGSVSTTLELKANFVRPLFVASGPLRCTGTLLHLGRTTATAEGRVVGADGRLYAHGTATLMTVPAP